LKIQLNPIAHETLIKSREPLPSELLKNTAALNFDLLVQRPELNAALRATDRCGIV